MMNHGNSASQAFRAVMLVLSILAWVGVWALWLALTHDFHPTFVLALIVTSSLVVAYAVAVYMNHLVLVPRLWATNRRGAYACWLAFVMVVLTAAALAVIRLSYLELWGPDPDSYGLYKHFAIDLFGMAVHVALAAAVVALARRFLLSRGGGGIERTSDHPSV
jgi:hypothetical protein